LFFDAQQLAALGAVGKRHPRGFAALAKLAHILERCRLPLGPRLLGTGEEKLQV
jgi:hypothetical protein